GSQRAWLRISGASVPGSSPTGTYRSENSVLGSSRVARVLQRSKTPSNLSGRPALLRLNHPGTQGPEQTWRRGDRSGAQLLESYRTSKGIAYQLRNQKSATPALRLVSRRADHTLILRKESV